MTKRDVWVDPAAAAGGGVPQTPNVAFPKDETWETQLTVSGSYQAFWGIQLSGVFDRRSGDPFAREVRSRAGLRQLSDVIQRVEPVGAQRYDTANLVSLRFEKQFQVGSPERRINLMLDVFNLLNDNPVVSQVIRSGPTTAGLREFFRRGSPASGRGSISSAIVTRSRSVRKDEKQAGAPLEQRVDV